MSANWKRSDRGKLMQSAVFLKAWATDRTVTWQDPDTDEEVTEYWDRREFWHVFKPGWWFTFATTNPGCGCRRRFGLWRVLTCSDHVPDWGQS